MPDAIDIETQIYTQIWSVLTADSVWAGIVDPGNRIRYDLVNGDQQPVKSSVADGDFPQATLRLMSGSTGLWNDDLTFETHSEDGPNFWKEKHQYGYRLYLVSDLLDIQSSDQLGAQSRKAIRSGGPRLKTNYIDSVTMKWASECKVDEEDKDKVRWRTNIDIIIGVTIEGSTL